MSTECRIKSVLGRQESQFLFCQLEEFPKVSAISKTSTKTKVYRIHSRDSFHLIIKTNKQKTNEKRTTLGLKFTLLNKHCTQEDAEAIIMHIRI